MTPSGFITVPEAIRIIASRMGDGDLMMMTLPEDQRHEESLACDALFGRIIWCTTPSLYVMAGGAPRKLRHRDSFEDIWVTGLEEEADMWDMTEGWKLWALSGRVANKSVLNGCLVYIRQSELEEWLNGSVAEEPRRSGAPGRPSSMDLVMKEFARRQSNGESALSRGTVSR